MHKKTNRGITFKFSLRLMISITLLAASSHVKSQTLAWSKVLDLPQEYTDIKTHKYLSSISHNDSSSAMLLSCGRQYFLYWFSPKGEIIHKSNIPYDGYFKLAGISSTKLAVRGPESFITYTRASKSRVTSREIETEGSDYEIDDGSYFPILGSQDLFGFFVMQRKGDSLILKRYKL